MTAPGTDALPGRGTAVAVALLGASAVALGALGAHALHDALGARGLEVWHTAVRFQFWHVLALVACALPLPHLRVARVARVAFVLGIVLFCGSLYALALGAPAWTGMLTPLGGLALLAGWLLLGAALWPRAG